MNLSPDSPSDGPPQNTEGPEGHHCATSLLLRQPPSRPKVHSFRELDKDVLTASGKSCSLWTPETDLGIEVAQRGLELVDAAGDPEELHAQFIDILDSLHRSEKRGRESEVDPTVVAEFRAALALDFDAGWQQPIVELCRELVPDLEQVPVNGPPEMLDLPLPNAPGRHRRSHRADRRLGRNDPCWCGSGKRYEHCHMWLDRGKRS